MVGVHAAGHRANDQTAEYPTQSAANRSLDDRRPFQPAQKSRFRLFFFRWGGLSPGTFDLLGTRLGCSRIGPKRQSATLAADLVADPPLRHAT